MQGEPKQLLPWGEGTLVQHTVRVVDRAHPCMTWSWSRAVSRQSEVELELQGMGVRVAHNPDWATGRAVERAHRHSCIG